MTQPPPPSGVNMQHLQGVFALYSQGYFREAMAAANELDAANPEEPIVLVLRGVIWMALGDAGAAVTDLSRAVELRPDVPDSHYQLGCALMEKGSLDEALKSFATAIELRPENVDAHSKYCQALDMTNRTDEMEEALARAREHCPGVYPALSLREAELLKRKGRYSDAREMLENSGWRQADIHTQEACAYLLCDLCDRLEAVDDAFAYAGEANRICRAGHAAQQISTASFSRVIDDLTRLFDTEEPGQWSRVDVDDGREDPVFLVGFPRSGTTLLDTILLSHERIAVLEEEPTMNRLESEFLAMKGEYASGLGALDEQTVRTLRDVYYTERDKHLSPETEASLIVDKLPFNLVQGALIHRVFPNARFLFAERHPCDCVLSCFMRSFKPNEAMVHFLDLEDAARLYDRVMSLWARYLEVLPLNVHTVRYEGLVEDFDETVSASLDHLGLEWDDAVRDYAETAKQRGHISTPSYNQVTQSLYTEASGRWLRYREHLEPVLPVLLPWAERQGYEGSS